jgi:hypothetical protein
LVTAAAAQTSPAAPGFVQPSENEDRPSRLN